MGTTGWIILGIIVLAVVYLIFLYNRLVALRQTVNQSWSDISVQLKQRHDLVPNLVETVKGYATHEKSTFEAVVNARNAAVAAQGPAAQAQAENMLTGALRQLFALAEAYPDLKANQNFLQLQSELADLENKIAASRRFFNNAVQEYNTGIQQFPAVLIARNMGFQEREFFELDEAERVAASSPAPGQVLIGRHAALPWTGRRSIHRLRHSGERRNPSPTEQWQSPRRLRVGFSDGRRPSPG